MSLFVKGYFFCVAELKRESFEILGPVWSEKIFFVFVFYFYY